MSSFGYDVLGFGSSATTGVVLPSDDEFNRVSFLSHFEGANNGVNNAFDDGSTSNHTITANGNVTQGSFGPFARPEGYWSVVFDNSDNSLPYFAMGANGSFDGNFTIEAFFNASSFTATNSRSPTVIAIGDPRLQVYIDSSSKFIALSQSTDQASQIVKSADDSISLNTWHHVAVVRSGSGSNNVSLYLDGARVAQATNTATLGGTSGNTWIASSTSAAGQFGGHISNVRILKGTAQYSGSSITVPTSGLTNVTNCVLLIGQSNRFVDNGANSLAINFSGVNPSVSSFGPFLTDEVYDPAVNGASAYFDGSGDKLTAPDSADWDFGSGNYTVEFWIYPRTTGILQGLVNHWADFNTTNVAWTFEWHSDGNLQYYIKTNNGTSGCVAVGGASVANKWMHVAAARNNNVHTLYLDGVSKATVTDAGTMNNCTDLLRVGDYFDNNYGFNGEICDVRVVKGTAVYTSNFTPPTAPLTAITNTKLLLNMADGQAIDSTAQNNMTLYGTAKLSTTQAKFGDTSLLLDGNSDYAYVYPKYFTFGTGDFTVEFQVYFNATTTQSIVSFLSADGTVAPHFYLADTGNTLRYYVGGAGDVIGSSGINTGQWYHVALSRSGTSSKLFLDGTQVGSTYSDSNNYVAGPLALGSYKWPTPASGSLLNGFLDEVRISTGVARYTNNFTAPTAPFADKGQ